MRTQYFCSQHSADSAVLIFDISLHPLEQGDQPVAFPGAEALQKSGLPSSGMFDQRGSSPAAPGRERKDGSSTIVRIRSGSDDFFGDESCERSADPGFVDERCLLETGDTLRPPKEQDGGYPILGQCEPRDSLRVLFGLPAHGCGQTVDSVAQQLGQLHRWVAGGSISGRSERVCHGDNRHIALLSWQQSPSPPGTLLRL